MNPPDDTRGSVMRTTKLCPSSVIYIHFGTLYILTEYKIYKHYDSITAEIFPKHLLEILKRTLKICRKHDLVMSPLMRVLLTL